MPTADHEGVCLRRHAMGEYDAVVTFLTRAAGKLSVVARGVQRPRSKNNPACQLCALSRLQLAKGRGLPVLAQAVPEDTFHALHQDVERSAAAAFLCELTDRALPEAEPHEEVFTLLVWALEDLQTAASPEALLCSYELRLMAALGWEPVLNHCAVCERPLGEGEVVFCPAAGGLVHASERPAGSESVPMTPRAAQVLRRLLDPERYRLEVATVGLPEDVAGLVRRAIEAHRRHYLDVELKSAGFLAQLRRMEGLGGG